MKLLLVSLSSLVGDVGVGEGEGVLGSGDNSHEASSDVLLEVLLGEVLDVCRGEGGRAVSKAFQETEAEGETYIAWRRGWTR